MNVMQHQSTPILPKFEHDLPYEMWLLQSYWTIRPFWDGSTQYWSNIISTLTEDRWNSLKTKSGN